MYEEEIRRGLDLLDEKVPGWIDRVNLDTLDMGNTNGLCVASQATGTWSYIDALRVLGLDLDGLTCVVHGFEVSYSDNMDQLQHEWVETIRALRAPQPT